MPFGPFQAELMPGAKNAVETCLAVRPEEHVALIADQASAAVAASLAAALNERKAAFTGLLLEDFGPRPMNGAPEPVLDALETADVGILCMNPRPGELSARMAIVQVVERRRIRYAHMVGVTPQIMQQGMRTDYKKVDQLSDRLRERMLRAGLGEDERIDQSAVLVELARGGSFYHARDGGRNICVRCNGRRLLQRQVRRLAGNAHEADD